MEMSDGSRRLIREWETGCMEEESCCCCCCCCCRCRLEAGTHRPNTSTQLLRQKDTPPQQMVQFFTVALLLLISLTLALALLVTVIAGRGHQSPDSQPKVQPDSLSSGVSVKQQHQKAFENPSALLTAPKGNKTDGDYLAWESDSGNAFCHGGFSYSCGDLVVPRDGMYRVFLQITYESNDDLECDDELRLTNDVFVIQKTYRSNKHLLSSVDTVSCSMKHWSKSLYTAGLFFLEADCRLRVTSSHPELIAKNEYQVFFGTERLLQ